MNPASVIRIPRVESTPLEIGNSLPLTFICGPCQLESRAHALETAEFLRDVFKRAGAGFIYKTSFDKANRSSLSGKRGAGLDYAGPVFEEIRGKLGVPVITDVHEPHQAAPVAEVCDVIQLPAFLSRQTDLVVAMAKTGAAINIKKAQFLAPHEMGHILRKCEEAGNSRLMLCERGSCFGYNNLVVDMLGFGIMKRFGYPVIFDVTHALQMPGGRADSAGGRRQQVVELGKAGMSQGIAGLFLEAHPDPDRAKCDGPCALPLDRLGEFLAQMKAMDELVKSLPALEIS